MNDVGQTPIPQEETSAESDPEAELEKERLEVERARLEAERAQAERDQQKDSHRNNMQMLRFSLDLMKRLNNHDRVVGSEELDTTPPSQEAYTPDPSIDPLPGETATDAMYRTGMVEGSIEPTSEEPASMTQEAPESMSYGEEDMIVETTTAGSDLTTAGTDVAMDIGQTGTEVGADLASGTVEAGADIASTTVEAGAGVAEDLLVTGTELAGEALVEVAEIAPEALAVLAL